MNYELQFITIGYRRFNALICARIRQINCIKTLKPDQSNLDASNPQGFVFNFIAPLRPHHDMHHRRARVNFGVSTRLWDVVFRTRA